MSKKFEEETARIRRETAVSIRKIVEDSIKTEKKIKEQEAEKLEVSKKLAQKLQKDATNAGFKNSKE